MQLIEVISFITVCGDFNLDSLILLISNTKQQSNIIPLYFQEDEEYANTVKGKVGRTAQQDALLHGLTGRNGGQGVRNKIAGFNRA